METKISPATQLSKKQMNAVKGGLNVERYQCHVSFSDGRKIWYNVEATDATDARNYVLTKPGAIGAECSQIAMNPAPML